MNITEDAAALVAEHVVDGELTANGLDLVMRLKTAERAAYALANALADLGDDTMPDQVEQHAVCLGIARRAAKFRHSLLDSSA